MKSNVSKGPDDGAQGCFSLALVKATEFMTLLTLVEIACRKVEIAFRKVEMANIGNSMEHDRVLEYLGLEADPRS